VERVSGDSHDKSPSKVLEFNEFGLVAITRKRVKQSLERMLCQPCQYCSGSAREVGGYDLLQHHHEVERMSFQADARGDLMIRVHPDGAGAAGIWNQR
jgi:ribonuclease G